MDSINKLKTMIKARQVPPMPVPLPPTPATPSAPTTPPATSPFGFSVNPCGSYAPDKVPQSCTLCKMSGFNASIGQIKNATVRSNLQRSINAISELCNLLKGCSEDEDNNPAPYGAGTACACRVLTSLITSFTGTFNAALIQDRDFGFKPKQIEAMKEQLAEQQRAARYGFDNCFTHQSPVAANPSLRDTVIGIINSYAT